MKLVGALGFYWKRLPVRQLPPQNCGKLTALRDGAGKNKVRQPSPYLSKGRKRSDRNALLDFEIWGGRNGPNSKLEYQLWWEMFKVEIELKEGTDLECLYQVQCTCFRSPSSTRTLKFIVWTNPLRFCKLVRANFIFQINSNCRWKISGLSATFKVNH